MSRHTEEDRAWARKNLRYKAEDPMEVDRARAIRLQARDILYPHTRAARRRNVARRRFAKLWAEAMERKKKEESK